MSLLRAAADIVALRLGAAALSRAPVWQTVPVGPPQPDYLNTAIAAVTDLDLERVLDIALEAEAALGRARRLRWGARTVDIDLLWHDGPAAHTDRLDVPHRMLAQRPFALAPLLALAPDARGEDGASLRRLPTALESPGLCLLPSLGDAFDVEEVDHTADEGFIVRALDRADLFAAAAEALGAIVVDPQSVAAREVFPVRVAGLPDDDDEARMVAWLSEVLYALDGERIAARRVAVIADEGEAVDAVIVGERLDEARHGLRTAVKAITWHGLEVQREDGGWRARVIVDI